MEALTCRECVYILRQTWSTSVALNKLNMAVEVKKFQPLPKKWNIFLTLNEQG